MLKLTGFWVFSAVNFVSSLATGIAATSLQESALWGVVRMRRSLKAGGSRMLLHQLSGHLTLCISLSPVSCTGDHNRIYFHGPGRCTLTYGWEGLEFFPQCKMATVILLHVNSHVYLKTLQTVTEKLCRLK